MAQISAGLSWFAQVDLKQCTTRFDRVQCWAASASAQVLDPVFEVVRRSGRAVNLMCRPDLEPKLRIL
ncbi:MAG: hypothetical protein WBG53_22280 [Rhodococcus sp. (in: high G+C Gram-positive bacteria)]|uniref:hypothetical protein n=1 Tax=unclassified Rhodococcus (in: high G+C Gram-positive bacteria) TaxID=192944 RepID=UPI000FFC8710|nr:MULTISPECIES: hypothetical protein [unclassified Rhodococcus (in: high G+C Gram-positive bacteria)]